jgi:hypothetical protein
MSAGVQSGISGAGSGRIRFRQENPAGQELGGIGVTDGGAEDGRPDVGKIGTDIDGRDAAQTVAAAYKSRVVLVVVR